jgi:hypothetical protein
MTLIDRFIDRVSTLPKLRVGVSALTLIIAAFIISSGATAAGAAGAGSDPGPSSSPSPSPSPGSTPGATPSPNATPSPTPGATPSPTPTATPNATPTPGATPNATPTPGATPGATPSPTPGATPSPTPGATPSPTPFFTPDEIEADLAGGAIGGIVPRGEAEFKLDDDRREFRLRVENVNLPAGTQLRILIDNTFVGNIAVASSLRRSELRLRSDDGQNVPQMDSRSRIVLTDAAGNTILAGSFSTNAPGTGPAPMPTPNPSNGEVRIESRLAGAAISGLTPTGHARFRRQADGRRDLNVEAEKVNLPAGTLLQVFIDGAKAADLVLSSNLENEVELETERGQAVPNVTTASTVVVTDPQGRTVLSGVFNTAGLAITAANDIDDSAFFVEQQYRDFLSREPDDAGLNFWRDQITQCGAGASCVEGQRNNTSGAFFLSTEFQETGFLLHRLTKATTGQVPRRNAFLVDMQALARGVIVGQPGWQMRLSQNKAALIESWVTRPEFVSRFGGLTNEQYVEALLLNAGLSHNATLRQGLIDGMTSGGHSRASILRIVAEQADFSRAEKNPAFVLMQYFGYLHRDPDQAGFLFWLGKLDDHGGDFHSAEMVKAFITSGEYRQRFQW